MPPPDRTAANCVLHPDRRASYSVQGIIVCTECHEHYRDEYRRSDSPQLVGRPFLQQLIKASADVFEETHVEIQ